MARTDLRTFATADEAYDRGRALREVTPTDAHDHAATSGARPSVAEFMRTSNEGRLEHLIDLRVSRMASSPFAFFRGSAGLMAADLAGTPTNGVDAQLCGDAHAANFGLYGSPHGEIVMDINDFDETLVGPWEWDIKRLAASLVLAGREGDVPEKTQRKAAEDAVRSYRRTMNQLAEQPFLRSWAALPDASVVEAAEADALIDDFNEAAEKARLNTSDRVVAKSVRHLEDHEAGISGHRFIEDPPILTHVGEPERESVITGLEDYVDSLPVSRQALLRRFAVQDVAFRIVGTGSVGIRSYIALLHGNRDEVLVLQLKQARPSALAPYLPASKHKHEGKRIVLGARIVQSAPDILLGWTTIDGLPFMVRQFRNMKGDIDPTALSKGHLDDYGRLAGSLLARAHTRTLDPRLLAGYFDDDKDLHNAIGEYAIRYADQVEVDHSELVEMVGREVGGS
ncbi:DUF2252 domain-containing protein [Smaragdicoccus niigatensis]|uniref:DUF2252 domain-containing protein n=1 Tax=Smaragdicoccus niigatensis TaxID=359359 RepID=UPI000369FD82|nr:DUF2252 domain-containing protein [Smaragdicoccus niigatensis]